MAEEALKKLEEGLNCSICLDTYTDPKLLQCNHVYCRQCLVPLVVRDQQGQLGLTCPTCRQVTPIPDRGVASLQSAFHINRFLEVQASLLKLENPATNLEGALGGASNVTPDVKLCFEHSEEELKLYCETCGTLVCLQCVIKDGKHHGHDCAILKKAFDRYKEEITASLEPMEKQVTTLERVLVELDMRCGEVSYHQETVEDSIRDAFRRLRGVLGVRETELVGQLDQMTRDKLKGLAAQRDQIETTLAQLNACLHTVKESFTGKEGDVLTMKADTVKKANKLATALQPEILKPNADANIIFLASTDVTAACQNHGKILVQGLPNPSECRITGKRLEVAVVRETSTAILEAFTFEGKPCVEPIKSLTGEIVSEITGARVSCSVDRRGQSQYEISYQPTVKGRNQLHIKIKDQHIRGSPFNLAAILPVEKLGTPMLTIDGVDGPWGVEINQSGEVVMTEGDSHCVSVFSPGGDKLRSFGTSGPGKGQFLGPNGVAVDGKGNILVADSTNHRIQKFTADGQFVAAVGTKGSGSQQFSYPTDIACCSNVVYVVDNDNHRVQVLNSDLTFCGTFGKRGSGKGQFKEPWGVACDSAGRVYVADRVNHRIQVFTAEGKCVTAFGKRGPDPGELDGPHYIAIAGGVVYISERNNHRISVFTSEGQFVTSFGSKGYGLGELSLPHGVAVGDNGIVCVCDCLNKRLQLF